MYKAIQRIFRYMFTIPLLPLVVFIFGMNTILSFVTNTSYDGFKRDAVYGPYGWEMFVDVLKAMYG